MRSNTRHIRWLLGMATMLLCLVVCGVDAATADRASAPTAEAVGILHEEHGASYASLVEKEDDMFDAAREMGQWAMPSQAFSMRATTGRVVTMGTALQRVVRMPGAPLTCEASCNNGLAETLNHTLSTKRFYAGYYIYYRCQMRC
ncbi:MAG: hypothetical protein IKJ18_02945 [Bacteroidaceae bacterium]|nr:hypothetical protein [Bacteroidaceae bacterium]